MITPTAQTNKFPSTFKKIFKSDKLGLLIALIIIFIVFSILTGNKYLTAANITNILISSSIVGLVVIGECFLLIVGHVDLSPGSVAAFSGVLVSILLNKGLPLFLAILLVLLLGLAIGFMNATLVNKLKLEPFIATLAAMSIFRGLAYIICNGKSVFVTNSVFLKIGTGRLSGIPIPVIICIIFFIVAIIVLGRTRFGRRVYMVGGNANSARLAGINAQRIRLRLYMAASTLAALGGILQAGRMSSGQPTALDGLEFDAVTAVVLGGVAMTGGVGTLGGAAIGLIIMQSFNNGLMMMNVPSFWQTVSRGLLLIVALSFDYFRNHRR